MIKQCPECREGQYYIHETIELTKMIDGFTGEVIDHQSGRVLGIVLECMRCHYKWKPRGVASSAELVRAVA